MTLGLLPNVSASLHVSIPRGGELISACALGVVVRAPLLTGAAVRLPGKGLLITIALALAVGNFASAAMPGFPSLLVLRFLTGLPHGAYFGVASVLAGNLVSAQKRSSAMAVVFAGTIRSPHFPFQLPGSRNRSDDRVAGSLERMAIRPGPPGGRQG